MFEVKPLAFASVKCSGNTGKRPVFVENQHKERI